jgi:hypothetical protein
VAVSLLGLALFGGGSTDVHGKTSVVQFQGIVAKGLGIRYTFQEEKFICPPDNSGYFHLNRFYVLDKI